MYVELGVGLYLVHLTIEYKLYFSFESITWLTTALNNFSQKLFWLTSATYTVLPLFLDLLCMVFPISIPFYFTIQIN